MRYLFLLVGIVACQTTDRGANLASDKNSQISVYETVKVDAVLTAGRFDLDRYNELFGRIKLKRKKTAGRNFPHEIQVKKIGYGRKTVGISTRAGQQLKFDFEIPTASLEYYNLTFDLQEKDWEYEAQGNPFNPVTSIFHNLAYIVTGAENDDTVAKYDFILDPNNLKQERIIRFKKGTTLEVTLTPSTLKRHTKNSLNEQHDALKKELATLHPFRYDNGAVIYQGEDFYVQMRKILYEKFVNRYH